jgi:hypothetical protein
VAVMEYSERPVNLIRVESAPHKFSRSWIGWAKSERYRAPSG